MAAVTAGVVTVVADMLAEGMALPDIAATAAVAIGMVMDIPESGWDMAATDMTVSTPVTTRATALPPAVTKVPMLHRGGDSVAGRFPHVDVNPIQPMSSLGSHGANMTCSV